MQAYNLDAIEIQCKDFISDSKGTLMKICNVLLQQQLLEDLWLT